MKKILLTILILFLPVLAMAGVAHYADLTDAGSSNDGTFAEPFNTIATINGHAFAEGDDLYFKADTTTAALTSGDGYLDIDWSGTSVDRAIIGAYDGDGDFDITGSAKPILKGTRNGPRGTAGNWPAAYGRLIRVRGQDYVTIQDIKVFESGAAALICDGGSTNLLITRFEVEDSNEQGIMFSTYDSLGVTDSIIENSSVEQSSWGKSGGAGIEITGGCVGDTAVVKDNIIRRNTVYGGCWEGIGLYKEVGTTTVEYNAVYDNRSFHIYVSMSHDITIRHNLVYESTSDTDTSDYMIAVDTESLENTNCRPESATKNVYIYGNLVANGTHGVSLANNAYVAGYGLISDNILIYNNTFVDNGTNIRFSNSWEGTNVEVKNNISATYENGIDTNDPDEEGVTWSHNLFDTDPGANANDNAGGDAGGPALAKTSGWDSLVAGAVDGTEFAITSASPGKDTGINVGAAYVNGLFTGTDFSASPPAVVTASQLEHGTWDIGAWIYDTGGPGPGGECLLEIEADGSTEYSVGKGDWDFVGTENTSGGTIAICKVAIKGKRVATPTTYYIDIYNRDGVTPEDLDTLQHAVAEIPSSSFPTGSPSWIEVEVSPTVDIDDGEVIVGGTRNVDDAVNYYGIWYGTDTASADIGIPERWAWGGVRQNAYAANDLAIKIYGYSAAAGAIAVDAVGIATVTGGIVTFHDAPTTGTPATLDALESSTGFPGWYWAVRLDEQPIVIAQPESSEFKWDCGPLSTDYDESPYYACLPDASNNYYLLYTPNLLAGHRAVHPQAFGTTAADYVVMNDAVIRDGDDNDVDLTFATVDIDAGGTITIGVADTFYIAATGADAATFTDLITAIDHLVPGDTASYNKDETFTETASVVTSGTSGNIITLNSYGTGADPIIKTPETDINAVDPAWTQVGATAVWQTVIVDPAWVGQVLENDVPMTFKRNTLLISALNLNGDFFNVTTENAPGTTDDFANWTEAGGDGTVEHDTAVYLSEMRDGDACKLIQGADGTLDDCYISTTVTLAGSTTYYLTYGARSDGTGTGAAIIVKGGSYLQDNGTWGGANTLTDATWVAQTADTVWVRKSVSFTTAADPGVYTIYFGNVIASQIIQIDNVFLYKQNLTAGTYSLVLEQAGDSGSRTYNVRMFVRLSDNTEPAANEVSYFNDREAINLTDESYITIDGLEVWGGVSATSTDNEGYITIQNCALKYAGSGVQTHNGPCGEKSSHFTGAISMSQCTGANGYGYIDINNNTITDCMGQGIWTQNSGTSFLINNNTIENFAHGEGLYLGATYLVSFSDGSIYENTVKTGGDDGSSQAGRNVNGIWLDVDSDDNNIYRNWVEAVNNRGIFNENGSDGNVISYNVVKDCEDGIRNGSVDTGGDSLKIYNNTILETTQAGIYLYDDNAAAGTIEVKNNIINPTSGYFIGKDALTGSTLDIDNNCYDSTFGTGNLWYFEGVGEDFAAWKAEAGIDDANSLNSDPLHRNAAGGDYHLTVGSPCKYTGDNTGVDRDFDDKIVPSKGQYSMGAHEFYGGGEGGM